ncbi:hypothetical protein [Spongiivirga citrea]|uniref:Uncharacterized protein n=1 Tax=Spongiivirga citrea TaxID=1481457 RepID=A0A6M0CR87_9FLAO|nr:hypothetical protein [Spongiivirga citrea]NER16460.1 hypothetical protein [Spongiivirga citrea]
MEQHFSLSDLEFERYFENCLMKPAEFTHSAHLRLAYIHITKYGIDKALKNIETQLQVFVDFAGAKEKYHKTLTNAAVQAVYHHMKKAQSTTYIDFLEEFPALQYNFKELINSHYSFDIFNSAEARTKFILPDLQPFC